MAYTKSRPDWIDVPSEDTLVRAQDIDNWEDGIFNAHALISGLSGTGVMSLDSSSSVGATTITLTADPPSGIVSRSSLLAIGTGATTCELRQVSSVAGAVVTLDRALSFAHTAADVVVWLTSGEAPLGLWGAKGDNATDDTTAVQAALDQSAGVANAASWGIVWINGMGCRYLITRPLIFPNGVRVKTVGKFKAATASWGTWGAVAETTNAMGISCQDQPVSFTVDTTTDVLTCSGSHNTAANNKIVVVGSSLPAPLISGRVYYVKTAPSGTTLTLALTSGGTTIDITTSGSGTMTLYPDVNSLERAYLDDVYFDGGAVANLNGFLGAFQQPCEWKKVRFDNFPGTGINISGQIAFFYNIELVACGVGLKLGSASAGLVFWGINFANCVTSSIEINGALNNGLYGVWIERSPIGVNFTGALSYGTVIDQVLWSMNNVTDPCVKVQVGAANSGSYEIRGSRFNNSTQLVIDDVDRGFQLTAAQIDQHQNSMGIYSQPSGPVAPVITNNSVRSPTTAYTATLADETILCNATGAAFTVTLPSAVAIAGKRLTIKKTDVSANAVTVDGNGSQTIDGATTVSLATQYDKTMIVSNGANWMVV